MIMVHIPRGTVVTKGSQSLGLYHVSYHRTTYELASISCSVLSPHKIRHKNPHRKFPRFLWNPSPQMRSSTNVTAKLPRKLLDEIGVAGALFLYRCA